MTTYTALGSSFRWCAELVFLELFLVLSTSGKTEIPWELGGAGAENDDDDEDDDANNRTVVSRGGNRVWCCCCCPTGDNDSNDETETTAER